MVESIAYVAMKPIVENLGMSWLSKSKKPIKTMMNTTIFI